MTLKQLCLRLHRIGGASFAFAAFLFALTGGLAALSAQVLHGWLNPDIVALRSDEKNNLQGLMDAMQLESLPPASALVIRPPTPWRCCIPH